MIDAGTERNKYPWRCAEKMPSTIIIKLQIEQITFIIRDHTKPGVLDGRNTSPLKRLQSYERIEFGVKRQIE
jgi:hypothetical protein